MIQRILDLAPAVNIAFALINLALAIWHFRLIGRAMVLRLTLFDLLLRAMHNTTHPALMLTIARMLARDLGQDRRSEVIGRER
jgi:hypothetical protein